MKKILIFFLFLCSCKAKGHLTAFPKAGITTDIVCYEENGIQVCVGYYSDGQLQVEY